MPEPRLQRTREAYVLTCSHERRQTARVVAVTGPDGVTRMVRQPQRFVVMSRDAIYCLACEQFVEPDAS